MKKYIGILSLVLSVLLILPGCKNTKNVKKIGILQFSEHEALDAARKGFIEQLASEGLKDGDNIEIDYKNASADQANCDMIANKFASENKDLILAIATPAAIAAARATEKIPILITAVTNPESSDLVASNEKPGKNVSGTSDLAPVAKQISLIKDLKKDAKNVGILYSSSETNSKYQADIAVKECEKLGMRAKIYTFSHSSDILQVVSSMKEMDAIYTPTDNAVASNLKSITNTASEMKIPVISWDKNSVLAGSVGTYGIDYEELGKITGKQACKILKEKQNPKDMPIEYLKNAKLLINKKVLDSFSIKLSDKILSEAEIL